MRIEELQVEPKRSKQVEATREPCGHRTCISVPRKHADARQDMHSAYHCHAWTSGLTQFIAVEKVTRLFGKNTRSACRVALQSWTATITGGCMYRKSRWFW